MRVFIKGGVWKNTEDEILKAAVMKYGKNMWARIASLLPRKSAKQVKARWYEWLDPSIKKTEWTREEEERLLHMAKLMPMQWRTIAPIVGRTAQQCLEHYEKLLDAATDPADKPDEHDDPRRLRPGEIDPHPETKPARPDPVDMDEDEKEMLSEARARLANTRGKKAKRKAREKQLEQARRLTMLQKRRELKAAGISSRLRRKRKNEIDYVTEIPFQKVAPAGFYSTLSDDTQMQRERRSSGFIGKTLQQLEGKRRSEEEKKARKKDKRRLAKLQSTNLPKAIMLENKLNDPGNFRKRSRLSMPAPQVTDSELEDIVKYGAGAGAGAGTGALVGAYGATPTPMRTPRTPATNDVIMEEARNLIKLSSAETPLKGGVGPTLEAGTGFAGVTPARSVATTPNALAAATPMGMTPAGATPGRRGPGATAMRDELSINQDAQSWVSGSTRAERQRAKAMRRELADSLASLPAPEYELDIVVPEVEGSESDLLDAPLSADAADKEAVAAQRRKALLERELARRSAALKRDPPLPRPVSIKSAVIVAPCGLTDGDLASADKLVQMEMVGLLRRDAAKYPVSKKAKPRRPPHMEVFTDSELAAAKDLLKNEEVAVRLTNEMEGAGEVDADRYAAEWAKARPSLVYLAEQERFVPASEASAEQVIASHARDLSEVSGLIAKLAKRATKLEAKVNVLSGGYQKRAEGLSAGLTATFEQLDSNTLELACFKRLGRDEEAALPGRLASAEAEATEVLEREAELQARYRELVAEREKLLQELAA